MKDDLAVHYEQFPLQPAKTLSLTEQERSKTVELIAVRHKWDKEIN
jgi:hypothetical protein